MTSDGRSQVGVDSSPLDAEPISPASVEARADPNPDERHQEATEVEPHGATLAVLARGAAVLALVSAVVGRAIGPALPGSRSGIDRVLLVSEHVVNHITQLAVFVGVALSVRLLISILRTRSLHLAYRFAIVPTGAAVITLVMMSASHRLEYGATMLLAMLTSAIVVASTVVTVSTRVTRAVGLALAVASLSSLLYVGARALGFRASIEAVPAMFGTARVIATFAFAFDVLTLGLVAAWLASRSWRTAIWAGTAIALVAGAVAWGAVQGSGSGAPLWQVIASRALGELARNPTPLLATQLVHFVEVGAFGLAVAACFTRGALSTVGSAAALLVLGRASADVPLGALALTLAAFLAAAAGGQSRIAASPQTGSIPDPV